MVITTIIQCTFNVSPNKHHRSALSFIFSCSRKRFSAWKTKTRKNENMSNTAYYNAPKVACSKFTITISFLFLFLLELSCWARNTSSPWTLLSSWFSFSFAAIRGPDRIREREISLIFHTLRTQRTFRSQTTAIVFSESFAHILLVQWNPALRPPR